MNKQEVMIDIAMNAGYLVSQNKIEINDSREFVNCIVPELANEFANYFNDKSLYIEQIDSFSEEKLLQLFSQPNK